MEHLYQHLQSSGLADRDTARDRIARLSEKDLENFLDRYVGIVRDMPLLARPLLAATDIYPDSRSRLISSDIIKRLSLYANRIYLHDDLFSSCLDWRDIDGVHQVAQTRDREDRLDSFRESLWEKVDFLLEIEPVVSAGIVHLLPTEGLHPRKNPGDFYAEDFYGPDGPITDADVSTADPVLAEDILRYFNALLKVEAPVPSGEASRNWQDLAAYPNIIKILLEGEDFAKEFRFFSVTPAEDFSETGKINMFHSNDPFGQDISQETFRNWVVGSARQVVRERVERLRHDVALSRHARAKFLTDLPISLDLLQGVTQTEKGVIGILNMQMPYFDGVDFKDIAKARRNEIAFEEFRVAIEKAIRSIPHEADTREFQERLDELSRDYLHTPMLKIQREKGRLLKNVLIQGVAGLATLGLFCINPALAIPGALFTVGRVAADAAAKTGPSRDKIEDMPGYFYWSATQKGL